MVKQCLSLKPLPCDPLRSFWSPSASAWWGSHRSFLLENEGLWVRAVFPSVCNEATCQGSVMTGIVGQLVSPGSVSLPDLLTRASHYSKRDAAAEGEAQRRGEARSRPATPPEKVLEPWPFPQGCTRKRWGRVTSRRWCAPRALLRPPPRLKHGSL